MTIKFHSNVKKPFLCKFIQKGFTQPWTVGNSISIYSGEQPTAAEVTANWPNYNATNPNFLAHIEEGLFVLQPSNDLLKLFSSLAANSNFWSSAKSTNVGTGIGTWAILWDRNISMMNVNDIVLPTLNFIVVSVSNSNGDGVIRFKNTNFTAGVFNPIYDGTIGASVL